MLFLIDPVVRWNRRVVAYDLTDRGLELLKHTKFWLIRFIGMALLLRRLAFLGSATACGNELIQPGLRGQDASLQKIASIRPRRDRLIGQLKQQGG